MTVLLSLFAALAYGASDFIAGLRSRRLDPFAVALVAQTGALVVLLLALPVAGTFGLGGGPTRSSVGWGLAAGIGNAIGTLALYRGLGRGRMSVVAPVSGLGAAVLPAVFGVTTGQTLSLVTGAGVVVGVVAVGLVSSVRGSPDEADRPSGLLDGIAAGVGFAELFVALDRAGSGGGLWPLVASSGLASAMIGAVVLLRRIPVRPSRSVTLSLLGAGALGSVAQTAFLLATARGALAVAAVLTSLYPGGTVLLAVLLLRERTTRVQVVGLLLAAVAVVAVTVG